MSSTSHAESMPRADRRRETARLLAEAAQATGEDRDYLVNQVIEINIGVAHAIANRFRGRAIPLEDLQQVACMALVRAAHRFDTGQDRDFLTYAVPTISGELKRHFRDHGWTVRPPRRIQEIQSRVIHAYKTGQVNGSRPSPVGLARELDLPEADVAEALAAEGCFLPASLDAQVGFPHRGSTVADQLPADEEADLAALEARLLLGPALRGLSRRERKILHLRFVREMTQQEIGDAVGLTQMQVSRILKTTLRRLRSVLGDVVETA